MLELLTVAPHACARVCVCTCTAATTTPVLCDPRGENPLYNFDGPAHGKTGRPGQDKRNIIAAFVEDDVATPHGCALKCLTSSDGCVTTMGMPAVCARAGDREIRIIDAPCAHAHHCGKGSLPVALEAAWPMIACAKARTVACYVLL